MNCPLRPVAILSVLCMAFGLSGCTYKFPYSPSHVRTDNPVPVPVEVRDFSVRTSGSSVVYFPVPWPSAARLPDARTYLPGLIAEGLRARGYSDAIDRTSSSSHPRIVIEGEVTRYRLRGNAFWWNFLNPLSLFWFVAIPAWPNEASAEIEYVVTVKIATDAAKETTIFSETVHLFPSPAPIS